jgi:hypothetical protein
MPSAHFSRPPGACAMHPVCRTAASRSSNSWPVCVESVLTLNVLRRRDFKTRNEVSGNDIHSCIWKNT